MEFPKIDVDQLMQRVRDEVLRRSAHVTTISPSRFGAKTVTDLRIEDVASAFAQCVPEPAPPQPVHLGLVVSDDGHTGSRFLPERNEPYHLNDLLQFDGTEFVDAAYQALLKREADRDGLQTYLAMLSDGASKVEILGRLRDSPEGRELGASMGGLTVPYFFDTISRWPIIGRFIGIAVAIWNLPITNRNQQQRSNSFSSHLARVEQRTERFTSTVYDGLVDLEESHNAFADFARKQFDRVQVDSVRLAIVKTIEAISTLQGSLDRKVDKSEFDGEVRTIRNQMGQKANHSVVTAVSRQLQSISQSKLDQSQ